MKFLQWDILLAKSGVQIELLLFRLGRPTAGPTPDGEVTGQYGHHALHIGIIR